MISSTQPSRWQHNRSAERSVCSLSKEARCTKLEVTRIDSDAKLRVAEIQSLQTALDDLSLALDEKTKGLAGEV